MISLPRGILSIPVRMASLVAQLVKNPPEIQKTWDQSLGWEGSLESGERKGYPLQYSCLESSMDYVVHRVTKSWTQLSDFHVHKDVVI